jgi:hypothetical protein
MGQRSPTFKGRQPPARRMPLKRACCASAARKETAAHRIVHAHTPQRFVEPLAGAHVKQVSRLPKHGVSRVEPIDLLGDAAAGTAAAAGACEAAGERRRVWAVPGLGG